MTTATLVILAALTLVLNPVRILAIALLGTLLVFKTIPAAITLIFLAFLYYLIKRKF
jgi:hypothetical protein